MNETNLEVLTISTYILILTEINIDFMPSFNFFKRKDKGGSKIKSNNNSSTSTTNKVEQISKIQDNRISIDDAEKKLVKIEENLIRNLLEDLRETFVDTNQVFHHINQIAENLNIEEIDVEEEKLQPLVQNTKNTIVRALRRESSNLVPIPKTFEDFVKFKDSLDASINRFGEVTSSHSRIVNTFMKKHANSLRGELKRISDYSEKLNDQYDQISKHRKSIEECRSGLLSIHSKIIEVVKAEDTLNNVNDKIRQLMEEKERNEKEINTLKSSSDYKKSLTYLQEKEDIERKKRKSIQELHEISSHLTKAANKYSYGLSKGTIEKIDMLVNKPSEIVFESDMSPYLSILKDIKESVKSNKIVLKDTNKIIQYFDILANELPKFKSKIKEMDLKIDQLKDRDKISILNKIEKKEVERKEVERNIESETQRKEELSKHKVELEEQTSLSINDIEYQLYTLSKKKYKIITTLK